MRKVVLCFLSLFFVLPPLPLGAAEEILVNPDAGKQMVRERVRVLREQRFKQMPYLDKVFVSAQIGEDDIRNKSAFVSSGQKTLPDVVDRASQVFTRARAAKERISLEKRRIMVALRNLFPEASFEFNMRQGELSGDGYVGNSYAFSAKQPIFRGGALWNALLQKKSDWEAARKDYEAVMRGLVKDVSVAYFEHSRNLEIADLQTKLLEDMKKHVDISAQKFNQNIVSEIENLNCQSLYSQMQYNYETSKQELELSKLELQRYLDLEIEDDISIRPAYNLEGILTSKAQDAPSAQDPVLALTDIEKQGGDVQLKNFVDMAYHYRPELQVEAFKLTSARLQEKITFADLLPKADITLEFGKSGDAYTSAISNPTALTTKNPELEDNFRLFLEVKWNLGGSTVGYNFEQKKIAPSISSYAQTQSGNLIRTNGMKVSALDGLKAFVDIKDAEVARLDRVVELEKKEKEVVHDVKQAYYDYQKSKIQVKSSLQRVDYQRRVTQLSKHKLENNEIQISEYMNEEMKLMNEFIQLHKALADYSIAKAKLNFCVGKDYFPMEELGKGYE